MNHDADREGPGGPELDLYAGAPQGVDAAAPATAGVELDLYEGVAGPAAGAAREPTHPAGLPERLELPGWMVNVWQAFPREIRDRYEPRGVIGEGGMGIVVEARDREMGRTVAIKGLRDPSAVLPSLRRRQALEARIAARLTHPNIVPVYDLWQDSDGNPWYSMLRVPGEAPTLARRLDELRALKQIEERPLSELLDIFLQVCRGAAYAHGAGIVHRDIKPDNIFLGPSGEALIADWGVAAEMAPERSGGEYVGTPGYASPEQFGAFGAAEATGSSDIFSLGIVLFELVVGRRHTDLPTAVESAPPAYAAEASAMVPEIPERIPRELAQIIRRSTAFRPADRFGSVQELIRSLDAYLAGGLVEGLSYSPRERLSKWARSRPGVAGAATTGLFFLALLAGAGVHQGRVQARLLAEANRNLAQAVAEKAAVALSDRQLDRARRLAALSLEIGSGEPLAPPVLGGTLLAGRARRGRAVWGSRPSLPPAALRFEPGGRTLAVADTVGGIRRLDVPTGRDIETIATREPPIARLLFDRKGRLITGGTDGTIRLRSPLAEPRLLAQLPATVSELAIDPDGRLLLAVTSAGSVHVTTVGLAGEDPAAATPSEVATARIGPSTFRALCADFAPATGGRPLAAVGGMDGTLRIWDPAGRGERAAIKDYDSPVRVARFSPDGKFLGTSGMGLSVRLWDVGNWRETRRLEGHRDVIVSLAFSPDGSRLASGDRSGEVLLWDLADRSLCGRLEGHSGPILELAFSIDGRTLASAGKDGTLRLWDTATCRDGELVVHDGSPPVAELAFHRTRPLLSLRLNDGGVRIIHLPTGLLVSRHELGGEGVAATPGEGRPTSAPPRWVATSLPGIGIAISRTGSGTPRIVLAAGELGPAGYALHPGGEWLATASPEGTVTVWDLRLAVGDAGQRAAGFRSSPFLPEGAGVRLTSPEELAPGGPDFPADHLFHWIAQAERGDPDACWNAALLSFGGLDAPLEAPEAARGWLRLAAEARHPTAHRFLDELGAASR